MAGEEKIQDESGSSWSARKYTHTLTHTFASLTKEHKGQSERSPSGHSWNKQSHNVKNAVLDYSIY